MYSERTFLNNVQNNKVTSLSDHRCGGRQSATVQSRRVAVASNRQYRTRRFLQRTPLSIRSSFHRWSDAAARTINVDACLSCRSPETFGLTSVPVRLLAGLPPATDDATQQSDPGLPHWSLADVEEDEDEQALKTVEDAEQDLHRRRRVADREQGERPRQTCTKQSLVNWIG